jgi:hypothetical protein
MKKKDNKMNQDDKISINSGGGWYSTSEKLMVAFVQCKQINHSDMLWILSMMTGIFSNH